MRCPNETVKLSEVRLKGGWQLLSPAKRLAWQNAAAIHLLQHLNTLAAQRRIAAGLSVGQHASDSSESDQMRFARAVQPTDHCLAIQAMQTWLLQVCTPDIKGIAALERLLAADYRKNAIKIMSQPDISAQEEDADANLAK